MVALGAADAMMHATPVDKFMQVACFAVRGGNNTEYSNSIIWSNGLSKTARVSVHDPEEDGGLIVCCPAPKAAGVASIDETSFYEFSKLPRLPRGDYDLCLEYQASSTSGRSFVLHAKSVHTRADDGGEVKVVKRRAFVSATDAINQSYAMFPQVEPESAGRNKRRARRDHGDSPYYSR